MPSDDPADRVAARVGDTIADGGDDKIPANKNDLVLFDGFPAMRTKDGPDLSLEGNAVAPRHPFWAHPTALKFNQQHLHSFREDCATVFTARTRNDQQSYSAGITYFLPCELQPRCALEALVSSIFEAHTSHLEKSSFVRELSGAEWWTLVMDETEEEHEKGTNASKEQLDTKTDADAAESEDGDDDDEVGMHFDADYGLEGQAPGLLLHPRVATVTYLSDFGAPTVVLHHRSPPPQQISELTGAVECGWISHPSIGKHMAFDGRLLHGAPSVFFPPKSSTRTDDDGSKKKAKVDQRRITLLVNVWLNHCPLDAEPIEEETISQLKTPFGSLKKCFSWEPSIDWSKLTEMPTISLAASNENAAGSEEVVICDHIVTIRYRASMEAFHKVSNLGDLVHVNFAGESLSLEVGGEVQDEDDEAGQDT